LSTRNIFCLKFAATCGKIAVFLFPQPSFFYAVTSLNSAQSVTHDTILALSRLWMTVDRHDTHDINIYWIIVV